MVAATRSVSCTLVLLVLFMYLGGIIFTGQYRCKNMHCEGVDPEMAFMFGSMGASMFTLFASGTLLDNLTQVCWPIVYDAPLMLMVFLVYILLASFTVLNMLIGVLCEVVSATAQGEKETQAIREVQNQLSG